MKNIEKDFDSALITAFRVAAESELGNEDNLEDYNDRYPCPEKFDEILKAADTQTAQPSKRSSEVMKRILRISRAVACLVLAAVSIFTLMSSKKQITTHEHGYTIREVHDGYEYFGAPMLFADKQKVYDYASSVYPVYREYAPTYIPEGYSLTIAYADWTPDTLYYICDPESTDEMRIMIFMNGTTIPGYHKKAIRKPEVVELPDGEYAVIAKDRYSDRIRELIWTNDEVTVVVTSESLTYDEYIKVLQGVKPIYKPPYEVESEKIE